MNQQDFHGQSYHGKCRKMWQNDKKIIKKQNPLSFAFFELSLFGLSFEVLTKPSLSQQQLQSLIESFENMGGDASAVRYLLDSQKSKEFKRFYC